MEKYYFIILVLILSISNTYAQNCYEKTRSKGIAAYNKKEYSRAKEYFNFAKDCGDKPENNDLSKQIKRCDDKLNPPPPKPPKGKGNPPIIQPPLDTSDGHDDSRVEPQTTLTVSTNNITFDASGDHDFTVNISTNASNWAVSKVIPWCNTTQPTASSIRLVCQPNTGETSRSDSFSIVAGDNSEKITVNQEASGDPVALGNNLYTKGKYEDALKLYRRGAERGSAEAQYRLGKMYLDGTGGITNRTFAMELFQKSAASGYSPGENALGYMYETQAYPDYKEAVKWYRKSADKGYPAAQYNLGMMYQYGYGVNKDQREANKWINKSKTTK
jgi:tetratricopeptide (TPR) repeat protein